MRLHHAVASHGLHCLQLPGANITSPEFAEFVQILRGGDPGAVDRLLSWLEPWLRTVIRVRLVGKRLRTVIGVSDVLQSLPKDFFKASQVWRRGSRTGSSEFGTGLSPPPLARDCLKACGLETHLGKQPRSAGNERKRMND